jgi:hypothetical protein
MYGMPPGMAQALAQNHQIRVYAAVYQRPWPQHPIAGAFGWVGTELKPLSPLPVETGTLTIDNTGVQRRTATLTTAPTNVVVPTSVTSQLTPYRNMVLLYYAVGTTANPLPADSTTIPPTAYLLGIFTLTDVHVSMPSNSGDMTVTMDLQDLSQEIARRTLQTTYVTESGIPVTRAVQEMLNYACQTGFSLPWFAADPSPGITSGTPGTTGGYTWNEGQDPWAACQQMAQYNGQQLYFGPAGACLMKNIPNPAYQPSVWTYASGGVPGVAPMITGIDRTLTQSGVFNAVGVIVESAYVFAPFAVLVKDTDPQSPTYAAGPFGVATDIVYDLFNFQQNVALIAAQAQLRKDLGMADQVQFTALPNPAHEAYDRITVVVPEIGLHQDYIIDTLELPLDAVSDMTVTARRVVNV